MNGKAILAILAGGVVNVVAFRLSTLVLGFAIPGPAGTVVALTIGEFCGGMLAARLSRTALLLDAGLSIWSTLVLLIIAERYAIAINGTGFEPATLFFLVIGAVAASLLGGRLIAYQRSRKAVMPISE